MKLLRVTNYCAIFGLLCIFMAGCTLGPDYEKAQYQLPDNWSFWKDERSRSEELESWWENFGDPVLTELIEQADANSLNLEIGLARITQSRALRAYATGENLPSIDALGSYSRRRYSSNALSAFGGENSSYSAGFDAFWEADIFGRIRRSIESAQAELEKSIADYNDLRVSLFGEVARNYIELRTAQARIKYALANIDIQRQTLELTQNRFKADIVPELDVAQAKLILANTEAEIPALKIAETEALNRLAVLLSTTPHTLRNKLLLSKPLPLLQSEPTVGLPAELLRRRPDIRSAERALAAQTARIGQAEAVRYPSLSLSGSLGFEAAHISDLGDWDSRTFGFGPNVRWNIFDGNRLKSLVAVEEALTRQLALQYEATVLGAVEEVENALIGFSQERQRLKMLRRSVSAAKQSVELVENLYRNGLTDFQNVLDAQRSLSRQQDLSAVSEGLILQRSIALYKALGGGWAEEQTEQE